MSHERLTNAAVEFMRSAHDRGNALKPGPDLDYSGTVAEDFVFEDRRSGGISFGRTEGRADFERLAATVWDAGSGRPVFSMRDIIAVRGERCAAYVLSLEYGSGMVSEWLNCVSLNSDRQQLQRTVQLDVDSVDDAIALLDEWHAAFDDEPDTPS
jgi:hypothetical protein